MPTFPQPRRAMSAPSTRAAPFPGQRSPTLDFTPDNWMNRCRPIPGQRSPGGAEGHSRGREPPENRPPINRAPKGRKEPPPVRASRYARLPFAPSGLACLRLWLRGLAPPAKPFRPSGPRRLVAVDHPIYRRASRRWRGGGAARGPAPTSTQPRPAKASTRHPWISTVRRNPSRRSWRSMSSRTTGRLSFPRDMTSYSAPANWIRRGLAMPGTQQLRRPTSTTNTTALLQARISKCEIRRKLESRNPNAHKPADARSDRFSFSNFGRRPSPPGGFLRISPFGFRPFARCL